MKCFLCYLLEEDDELADLPIPLTANLTVVTCRAGEGLIRELFEPLAYSVVAEQHPLDEKFPEWGEGPYYSVALAGTFRLQDLLNHLYVLVPVLDAEKHYWIGQDEVEKLLRKGEGWLGSHPQQRNNRKALFTTTEATCTRGTRQAD